MHTTQVQEYGMNRRSSEVPQLHLDYACSTLPVRLNTRASVQGERFC